MLEYKPNFGGAAAILQAAANVIAVAERERLERIAAGAKEEWHKLSERLPTDRQVVLVMAEAWTHPRVLEYVEFPFPRLLDRQHGWHYWYPERMQWRQCPMPTDGVRAVDGSRTE